MTSQIINPTFTEVELQMSRKHSAESSTTRPFFRFSFLVLFLLACGSVLTGCKKHSDYYNASDVPNPILNHQACNIHKSGYLCDPENLLSEVDQREIVARLDRFAGEHDPEHPDPMKIRNKLTCPKCRERYKMYVVVVPGIHLTNKDKLQSYTQFAADVYTRFNPDKQGWHGGHKCGFVHVLGLDQGYGYAWMGDDNIRVLKESVGQIYMNIQSLKKEGRYREAIIKVADDVYNVMLGRKRVHVHQHLDQDTGWRKIWRTKFSGT